jgi:hypothetical protein
VFKRRPSLFVRSNKMANKKGGSGIVEGLWAGTAFFAATKAKTFPAFITSFLMYAVVLIVFIAVGMWVLKTLGLQVREKMTDIGAIQCQAGEVETNDCYGERGCAKGGPPGSPEYKGCYKLNTPSGGPAA